MDLSDRIALVYAEDLMQFVMRHREIYLCESSLGSDAFENEAKGHFPFDMGAVVVGLAKGEIKIWLEKTKKVVLEYSAVAGFEAYIRKFVQLYFEENERNPTNIITLLAYIVEASVLLFLNHVEDALLQGIRTISRFIQDTVPDREDILGGLEYLLQGAIIVKKNPDYKIYDYFLSGTFYGDV